MSHFKNTTLNHVIIMGRKTFESIGHPLPKRTNIVLTHNQQFCANNVLVYHDINKIIQDYNQKIAYVIGGKEIYLAFAAHADQLIVSKIKKKYNCNISMKFDFTPFKLTKIIKSSLFDIEYYSRRSYGQ
jgi:dihydrofolate reductase